MLSLIRETYPAGVSDIIADYCPVNIDCKLFNSLLTKREAENLLYAVKPSEMYNIIARNLERICDLESLQCLMMLRERINDNSNERLEVHIHLKSLLTLYETCLNSVVIMRDKFVNVAHLPECNTTIFIRQGLTYGALAYAGYTKIKCNVSLSGDTITIYAS